ncbi:SGNH hydrolase-type esterase domain-containing protein [Scheffersomyces coipomensis]|uniref:SGNH hydrolase-type esterase domain-containing protein n=1 Tax=Scheffersomyces coipomensis TaxID=1788519 RepID=UPI00315DF783
MSQLLLDKFILFGDSITQFSSDVSEGFALQPQLQHLYVRKLDVINRGYSGYNSEQARLILPKILNAELNKEKSNVKLITIFFGTNDSVQFDDEFNDIQAVPIDRYKDNLDFLINLSLEANIKPIIIGTGLHDSKLAKEFFESGGRIMSKDPLSNSRNHEYSKAAEEIANKNKVAFVNLFEDFAKYGNLSIEKLYNSYSYTPDKEYTSAKEFVKDGLHFTPIGYKVLYESVVKAINNTYPELNADALPLSLSDWKDLDPKNLESTIFRPGDLKN